MKYRRNEYAQVGIGTLIIFIAMVLVAAVAAAVLISTSGVLQQKAHETGTETISEVSSNLLVETIIGYRASSTTTNLSEYNITIKPAAGAGRIDLNQLVITVTTKDKVATLTRGDNATATTFKLTEIRDDDDSFNSSNGIYVINSGDLIKITIDSSVGIAAPPRTDLTFILTPEVGSPVTIDLTTPTSYGINTFVRLYPIET